MNTTTDQIVNAESGGDPTAANPNSSAAGPGQFIDSTWLNTVKQHAPDVAQGKSDAEILALKNDPQLAAQPQNIALAHQMTDAYAGDNQAYLAKNGVPVTPGSTYLAHFAGPGGAVKIMQADPNAPVSDILGPAAVKANPFLQGMTAQELQAWAAKRMGAQSPTQQPQQTAQQPSQSQQSQPIVDSQQSIPPTQPIMVPNTAPIFASAPQAVATAPVPQAAPIFFAPRKQIDLSGLRAALARAPIFANSQG